MRIAALVGVFGLALAGCGTAATGASDAGVPGAPSTPDGGTPGQSGADGAAVAIGDPCVPEREESATFAGFVEQEVAFDLNNAQCGGNQVCLVNHFQGRVTCPYGQDWAGHGPDGLGGCRVAGGTAPVTPTPEFDPEAGVEPQCAGRTSALAVYCSCRCANASGGTDDGTYCTCPSGTTCTQLVGSIGAPAPGVQDTSGAYCVKDGTLFDGGPCGDLCDPKSAPCP